MRTLLILLSLATAVVLAPAELRAQDVTITIKNHRFTPSEVKVPANKRIQLTVVNDDPTPEEFESREMKVEKVIPGKSKGVFLIGRRAPRSTLPRRSARSSAKASLPSNKTCSAH
jgi:hypothetical protein